MRKNAALISLFLLAACGSGASYLDVTVASSDDVAGVAHLAVALTVAGKMAQPIVVTPPNPPFDITSTNTISFGLKMTADISGAALVDVTAQDAQGATLAHGSATATVTPGSDTPVLISLPGFHPPADMAGADGTTPDQTLPDLNSTNPDLGISDLSNPDLSHPDLGVSDLSVTRMQDGFATCGGNPVDLNTDPANCGACGVVCAGSCHGGHCWPVTATPLPTPVWLHATSSYNGRIYVLGGARDVAQKQTLTDVAFTNVASDGTLGAWTATTPLPMPRSGLMAAAANGFLYAYGGIDGSSGDGCTRTHPTNTSIG